MDNVFVIPKRNRNNTNAQKPQSRQRTGNRMRENSKMEQNLNSGELIVLRPKTTNVSVSRKFSVTALRATDASGNLTISSYGFQDIVGLLGSEFSNFAQEWQEYRPKSLSVHLFPMTTNATSSTGPYQGGLIVAPWAQVKVATLAGMQQSNSLVKMSTLEEKEIKVNRPAGPNFLLWNPYGTSIPIDRDFGLSDLGLTTLAVSSNIFTKLYEIEVEFRMPA